MEGHSPWVPAARLRMLSGPAMGLAVALATTSCERPATQLAIELATDLDPADTTCIFVEAGPFVVGETTPITDQRVLNATLPTSFGVAAPGDDPTARVELRVTAARSCTSGVPTDIVVTRTIRTGFVRHRRIDVEMFLSRECIGVPCGVDTDCDRGRCVPVDVDMPDAGPVVAADTGPSVLPDAGMTGGCTPSGPTAWFMGAPISMGFDVIDDGGEPSLFGAVSDGSLTYGYFDGPSSAARLVMAPFAGAVDLQAVGRSDGWIVTAHLDEFGTPRIMRFAPSGMNGNLGTVMTGSFPRRALTHLGTDNWYGYRDDATGQTELRAEMGFGSGALAPPGATEVTLGRSETSVVVAYVMDPGTPCVVTTFAEDGSERNTSSGADALGCSKPEPFERLGLGTYALAFRASDGDGEGVFLRSFDASLASMGASVRIGGPATNIAVLPTEMGGFVLFAVAPTGSTPAIEVRHFDADGDSMSLGTVPLEGDETIADLAGLRVARHEGSLYVAWHTATRASYVVMCDPFVGADLP